MIDKNLHTESVQKGRFVCYAQGHSKYRCSLRGIPPDALRRDALDRPFLQKDTFEETFARDYPAARPSRLSSFRTDPGFDLRDHHGYEADQQNRDPAIQRILFGDPWVELFSGSNHVAKVFETIEPSIHPSTGKASRQSAGLPVWISEQTDKFDIRFGLGGHHRLWQTRKVSNRIQSQETRQAVVPPVVLLRIQPPGILARFFAARQYDRRYRSGGVHESLSGQSAKRYCQKQDPAAYGFGILWPEARQIPRRIWLWLRHRCQRIYSDQSPSAQMQIPTAGQWLGGGRILRQYPSEMGQFASVHRGSASYSGRSCGSKAVDFVQRPQVRLSCIRHQSDNVPMASIPILQPKGNDRKKQSGIPIRLSVRQNPNKNMDSQCRFFPITLIRGQYCPLVQKNLPAQKISYDNARYDTHRFFGFTGKIDQTRQSKYFAFTKRLQSSPGVPAGAAQHSKTASA